MMRSQVALSALLLAACAADTSSPAVPSHFEVVMGGAQVGAPARSLDTLVVVRLVDDRGGPIPDAGIRWSVTGGGGQLEPQSATTGPDGLAVARWTLGNLPGDQTLQVLASGVDPIEVAAEARGMQARAVAVTNHAICAIDTLRVTRCWGNLDQYDAESAHDYGDTPVVVDSALRFTQIAGGSSHVCALTATGAAWCWGYPLGGQLGTGAGAVGSKLPQQVLGGHAFTAIVANWRTTCALDTAGQAWCWGSPGDGSLGTGGLGPNTELQPAAVLQGSTVFTAISLGYDHICALDTNAEAWCWGHQDVGQLGDSSNFGKNAPTKVAGQRKFASIAAGDHFTCAAGVDRSVWCWGAAPIAPYAEDLVPTSIGTGGISRLVSGDNFVVGIQAGRPVGAGTTYYSGIPAELAGGTFAELPGGLFAVDRIVHRWATICMIRTDDQLFCLGEVPGFGTTSMPVGIPAP